MHTARCANDVMDLHTARPNLELPYGYGSEIEFYASEPEDVPPNIIRE